MIRETLDVHAASLNRLWSHDRTKSIGASEIGQCARKTYWTKHGGTVDDDYVDGWGAKLRGTVIENAFWAPAMKERFGDKLLYAGKDQKTFRSGYLSATPDGLLVDQPRDILAGLGIADIGGDAIMAECKTIDPRATLKEAKFENIMQTQTQMGLVRELTQWQPSYSLLSYIDASFWDQVTEFVIPFNAGIFGEIKKRATVIMTASDPSELKPEGWIGGGSECERCPFARSCGIERRRVPENAAVPDRQFVAEITDLCGTIKHLSDRVDVESEQLRALQDDLKTRLREKKVRKIPGVVSWSSVKGRAGWNNAAIRDAAEVAGVDLTPFKTCGDATDRLVITLPNPKS